MTWIWYHVGDSAASVCRRSPAQSVCDRFGCGPTFGRFVVGCGPTFGRFVDGRGPTFGRFVDGCRTSRFGVNVKTLWAPSPLPKAAKWRGYYYPAQSDEEALEEAHRLAKHAGQTMMISFGGSASGCFLADASAEDGRASP